MKQYLVDSRIETIAEMLPFSHEDNHRIKEKAIELSKEYLKHLSEGEIRISRDIILSSIYLSSREIGNHISQYEIATITGHSLSSWPRIVVDMDKRVNGK